MIFLQIVLNKVLLVGTRTSAYIGKPVVTNASVHAVVEEQVGFMNVAYVSFLAFYLHFFPAPFFRLPNFSLVLQSQGLDAKKIVFKYKRKKNYRRNIGHRQVHLISSHLKHTKA